MDLGLAGRVALITGSTRGLGRAIAEALASEGVNVIINGRSSKTVGDTAYEIEHKFDHKIRAYQCTCDATDSIKINEFFHEKMSSIGRLDILVNNIGNLEKFGSFLELNDNDWFLSHNISFMSMVRFTREAIPYLQKSKHGRIINISSLPSHQPGNFNPHYSVSKAAMNNLTKHLANALGPDNILVNAICPSSLGGGGWIENVQDRAKRDSIAVEKAEQIMRQEESKKSPLNRMGTPENLASLVLYLASDQASFQTGHIYNVDGGITRGI